VAGGLVGWWAGGFLGLVGAGVGWCWCGGDLIS